jgi:SulP family sulfate permease
MATHDTARRFPVTLLEGILPIDRPRLPLEIVAGVTLAALAIPETMGYTKIAGTPVITGLYTILFPLAVFAIFGSSRHLVVGADSATAAILAAGLAGMAATGSEEYVALAGLVALLAAAYLFVARLVRLGFLADFLSRTVLIGFLTGVGIQVACGQVGGMLGIPEGSGGTLRKLWGTLKNVGDTSGWTLLVSAAVLAIILFGKYVTKVIPGALVAVIGSIAVSWAVDLQSHGVAVLGPVPGGLPSIGLPDVNWRTDTPELAATAFSIFIVILAQSAATSRAYAAKYQDSFHEDTDLVGLGMANVAAGVSGTFVVNGSPTKTQMVDGAGGKSQVAALSCAAVVLIVLLFLTKPLKYMPEAVLSSVVFLIGIELIDVKGMRKILRVRPAEFVVAAITAAIVVVVGVEQGILLAIVLSIIDHLRRSYKPFDAVLRPTADGSWKETPVTDGAAQAEPGLVMYRFGASLYYANVNRFADETRRLVADAGPGLRWFCLVADSIGDVDYSAAETLREIHAELAGRGVRLVMAVVDPPVQRALDRYGITDLLGAEAFYPTPMALLEAYRSASRIS